MSKLLLGLLLLSSVSALRAEVLPAAGYRDARVKTVAYDENDVVKLVGRYGYSMVIEFAPGEAVTDVALGDTLAWEVAPSRSNVFVKPREDEAATNMTVVTDKRIYHFMLQALPHKKSSPKDAYFSVRFRYPAEEAAKRTAELEAQRAKAALATSPKPANWNYWACGDRQLRPTEVYDDGRFTFLRFPGAQEIPAIFFVNSDDTESLSNGQMRGDQFVVFTTAKKLVLRKGKSVACLQNRSFNWYGVYTTNGTTSPQVQRTIEGSALPPPLQTLPEPPAENQDAQPTPYLLPVPGAGPGGLERPASGAVLSAPALDPQASSALATTAPMATATPQSTLLPLAVATESPAGVLHAKPHKDEAPWPETQD
jgi:type IV secretion system protein VirB9